MQTLDIGAILTFLGGVIVTLITALSRRGLHVAQSSHEQKEGEASLSEATLAWARHLEESLTRQINEVKQDSETRIGELYERVATLEVENDTYRRHIAILMRQLIAAGIPPVPPPDPHPRSVLRGIDAET